jgi:hypothetical protein
MSERPKCLVEYIGAANQGVDQAIWPAKDMVEEGGSANADGEFVVSCDRCEAEFMVTAALGERTALTMKTLPATAEDACVEARYRTPRQWVMNLSPLWFNVQVLNPAKE